MRAPTLLLPLAALFGCYPIGEPLPALEPEPPTVAGFDAQQIARLARLTGAEHLPPDPSNRVADDPAAAALGQALFFADLGPHGIGCPTCHDPERAFSGMVSYDAQGGLRLRNPPSLLGSAHQRWFFWDGRADSAWAQARTPLEDPEEIASDRLALAHTLAERDDLRARYTAVFGPLPPLDGLPRHGRPGAPDPAHAAAWDALDAPTQRAIDTVLANVGKALAAYQRRLISTDAPLDRLVEALLDGDAAAAEAALSPEARRGAALFVGQAGCVDCHDGPVLSDGSFHDIGLRPDPRDLHPDGRLGALEVVQNDPFNAAGPFSDAPDGLGARRLAGLAPHPADGGAFRTPTLRNVALTPPFGHDGRFPTLEAIVRYKLDPDDPPDGLRSPLLVPRDLDDDDVAALLAFLDALTGAPLDPALLGPPEEDP